MPKVTFRLASSESGQAPNKAIEKTVEVPAGTTLFNAAHLAGLPVASSCGAEGVCGKCNMQILAGEFREQSELEKMLLRRDKNPLTDRISCQTKVIGDCTVTTRYW